MNASIRPPRPPSAALALLAAALAAALSAPPAHSQSPPQPQRLLVQVRDTPPGDAPSFHYGSDNSYTVSTGGTGETRDERAGQGADNGSTVSTSNSTRQVVVIEGQRVRVDLPTVQSLQFHVPFGGRNGKPAGASAAAGSAAGAGGSTSGAGAGPTSGRGGGPAADAVVYYESVAAFAARFAVRGAMVIIELVPLRASGVAAPVIGDTAQRPVVLQGRVGTWIALGDADVAPVAGSLSPSAEAPSPASVWVRVVPAAAAAQPGAP